MRYLLCTLIISFLSGIVLPARTFDVLVYNVENLFDADGVALYDDYKPDSERNPNRYSPRKVLTKLQNITEVVQTFNNGRGPDIILFQELERDFTPAGGAFDYAAFLKKYEGQSLEAMLTDDFDQTIADLPAEALLLKYFEDLGLSGYAISLPEPAECLEDAKAHNNVTFSRFPVLKTLAVPTYNAREVLVTEVEVDGAPLTLINCHWKSGASRENSEDTRVQNAKDTRAIVDAILDKDPFADVIVAGDLNTYYNASAHFPAEKGWTRDVFAIEVLGSQGDELAIRELGGPILYNLWFELPPGERRSELYQGDWGTLMQMLISRGLYDEGGIQYVDHSFRVVELPGINSGGAFNAPADWHFLSETGGGYSDHYPVVASFKKTDQGEPGSFLELDNPVRELTPVFVPGIDLVSYAEAKHPDVSVLDGVNNATLASNYGNLYEVSGRVIHYNPLIIATADRVFPVYAYDEDAATLLSEYMPYNRIRFIGELSEHRGTPQFIIHHPLWICEH